MRGHIDRPCFLLETSELIIKKCNQARTSQEEGCYTGQTMETYGASTYSIHVTEHDSSVIQDTSYINQVLR